MTASRGRAAFRWGPGPALIAVVLACGMAAAGLYAMTVRGAGGITRAGRVNARALADLETGLGLGWTHDLARTWLAEGPLGPMWVTVYALGYWPFLAVAGGWTIAFDRTRLRHFAALVGVTGLVGVVAMVMFPVSPPRLVGAFDPIAGTALESIAHPERLMNEHGAMPSFHVAWSTAAAATLAAADGPMSALRRMSWLQPVLMTVATLTTGNHWVSDAAAGLVLVAVSWRPVRTMVEVARRHLAAQSPERGLPEAGRPLSRVDR